MANKILMRWNSDFSSRKTLLYQYIFSLPRVMGAIILSEATFWTAQLIVFFGNAQ